MEFFKVFDCFVSKKYIAEANRFIDAKTSVQALMKENRALIKDDMDAFNALMKALKEKGSERNTLISEASIKAVSVPLRILEKAEEGIQLANMLINKSNPNVESDIEVAIACFECAGRSAIVNVRVNLPGLNDGDKADEYLYINSQESYKNPRHSLYRHS